METTDATLAPATVDERRRRTGGFKPAPTFVSRWPASRLGHATRTVLFFALCYLYLWLIVKPCLIYNCGTITNFPIFYRGWAFFQESMSPRGAAQYASALLSQLFYYSWAGAIVITVQAWGVFRMHELVSPAVGVPGARWLRFVPALLALATYARTPTTCPRSWEPCGVIRGCLYVSLAGACRNAERGMRNAEWIPSSYSALRIRHAALDRSGHLRRTLGGRVCGWRGGGRYIRRTMC